MKESSEYIESRVQTKYSVSWRLRVQSFALANEAVGEVVAAVSGPAVIIAVSGPTVIIIVAAFGIATAAVVTVAIVVAILVAAALPIVAILARFVSPSIGFVLVGQQALVVVLAVVFVIEIVIGSTYFVVEAVIVFVVVPLLLFSLLSLAEQIA